MPPSGARGIVTPTRQAAFIAQIGHESGQFRYVRELGNDKYLAKYDTGTLAARLGNTPTADGDGQKYRGRGLIQITGHDNYEACGEALGLDLVNQPELLELPQHAAASAAWFWQSRGLNTLADRGDFVGITRQDQWRRQRHCRPYGAVGKGPQGARRMTGPNPRLALLILVLGLASHWGVYLHGRAVERAEAARASAERDSSDRRRPR
ncbi:chitinase [Pseudomonas putida S11]|nr:chitinase [Pseudomonas putida S11]